MDRPLTGLRHWRRAHLRQVAVRTRDGANFTGRVGPAGAEAVTLLVDGRLRELRYADVEHAAVQVEFRPAPEAELSLLRARRQGQRERGRMNVDIAALRTIEREKDIPFETVLEAIETALLTAYRHTEGHQAHARVDIDRKTGAVRVLAQELAADGAVEQRVGRHPGGLRPDRRDHRPAGHPAAAARRRTRAHLRRVRGQGGRDRRRGGAARRPGERARRGDRRAVRADRGRAAAGRAGARRDLPARRADPLLRGRGVAGNARDADHVEPDASDLVRKLFALEVPEIVDGSVEIVAVAREAGHRSKIAVRSTVPGVNPKGACIGPVGARVRGVMSELAGEKIDIIDWSEDPATFVGNALSPSKVVSVTVLDARSQTARVVVPDFQLSLAIGKEGQNARLAARLTGWRIDIRSDADPRGSGDPRPPRRRTTSRLDAPRRSRSAERPQAEHGRTPGAALHSVPVVNSGSASAHPTPLPTLREPDGGTDPDLCRVPRESAADGLLRVAWCMGCSPRTRGGGSPAEVPGCTPFRSAWTGPSDARRSRGRCASRGRWRSRCSVT